MYEVGQVWLDGYHGKNKIKIVGYFENGMLAEMDILFLKKCPTNNKGKICRIRCLTHPTKQNNVETIQWHMY
jgi:hypothetical protein